MLSLSILPFEEHWYAARGHDVNYVGNPLLLKYANENMYEEGSKKVLLLPGSRMQEIKRLMPEFIAWLKHFQNIVFMWYGRPLCEKLAYRQLPGTLLLKTVRS